jgi:L-threonylcarbamoyladenylate synthase
MDNAIHEAAEIIRRGGIVIFPTDTAFGIGCRMDDHAAVDRLYGIRERPVSQAAPVLVDSIEMAEKYLFQPSDLTLRIMKQYWPGQVTVVSPCVRDAIYAPVRGGGDKIGFRMPDHTGLMALIGLVGVPILAPSANFHGGETPFSYSRLDRRLLEKADFALEGECKIGIVSTVVDTTYYPPRYIRRGYIQIPEAI